jgi:hypothetical protein
MSDESNAAPSQSTTSVNILPSDTHGDILVQLIRGQERAATQLQNLNERLFGANGQTGALPFLVQQHKDVAQKLDDTKTELLNRIDTAKEDLSTKMGAQKEATDADIEKVDKKHNKLDKKVTWYAGGIAAIGGLLGVALTLLEIFHHH